MHRAKQLMKRKKNFHKGDSGYVLVVGGSEDYVGAVALVGLAALRSGCDLVAISAPSKVSWAVNCLSADLVTHKLRGDFLKPDHVSGVLNFSKKFDVVVLGNGAGVKKQTKLFFKKFVLRAKEKLKVIDADAIKTLKLNEVHNAIITPHSKELEILLRNSKVKGVKEIQKHLGSNVLLIKGATDKIISKNKIKKITGGNPGMAKAGTGDVLAGLCAGFLAQGNGLFESAVAASRLNKQIGDLLLKKKKGYVFLASDMVDEINKIN